MAESKRYAVVTGANKRVGFEVRRQLVSHGITVVLTARDEKTGLDALHELKGSAGLSGDLLFHQPDVADSSSVASLAEFIKNRFDRLDILTGEAQISWGIVSSAMTDTYELAVECLEINYYGAKRMVEAFLPLLQLSQSPGIVNVSSDIGTLKNIPGKWAKGILSDVNNLTAEKVDEVLNTFLKDFKKGSLEANGWPLFLSAYTVSKVSMNAYTRILAKKHQNLKVNCVCPGFAKTDINFNSGIYTAEECAERVVKIALQPDDGSSGLYFVHGKVTPYD